ncbi:MULTISPECIES: MOP flippase family protein [unclassified Bacillus (in: firmicutes)]|uniref:teichuronic acid biosynthesis protein TuaB n=1 Tax=unclassified Bacillus (in: firmicutes) TaxID=185979 RepID=UPI001BE83111|nr:MULTISPECIES: MOP flippase family protein [unclassified Bacillus (in: firmicutes)]MBT2725208.1 MOP flippase family protein [Bacillus sp. ISL-46]MBT2744436.1 MOP flippase family protein [Bacillus sp. ISL-77]
MSVIRNQLHKGVKWTGISTLIITALQIIQFALLGKMMSISEFGLVGMITTIVVFAQILLDLGFGTAVIQKEGVSARVLSSLFWLNVVVGIGLFVLLFLFSPLIATYFQRSELVELIRILAVMFLIAPVGQQCQYLLQKELRFNLLGAIEVGTNVFSFLTLVILILSISPIYAFVISQVVLNSLKGILYFMCYQKKWRPSLVFNLSECKEYISFGAYQLASRLVNRIGSNLDVILIGRFMGAEALGIYNLAYQIVTIPVLKINPIITRVAFPVFSKSHQNQVLLTDGFLHMTKLLSLVSFPILMGLTAVSNVFILTIFGQKWLDAVPVVQIMAVVGILRVLMNPNGSVILAKGKANIAFYWDAGVLILYGASLWLAVMTNKLEVVAWTYAGVSLVNFLVGRWLLNWLIQLRFRQYLQTISVPFQLSMIITVIAFCMKEISAIYFPQTSIWPLIFSVGISAVTYILLLYKMYPHFFLRILKKQIRGKT